MFLVIQELIMGLEMFEDFIIFLHCFNLVFINCLFIIVLFGIFFSLNYIFLYLFLFILFLFDY